LVLSGPPLPRTDSERDVLAGVRAGLPLIAWSRSFGRAELVHSTISTWFNHDGGFSQTSVNAGRLRREAWRLPSNDRHTHAGFDLTVLWDDPERQPERFGGGVAEEEALR
jgi:hypothetical protein